MHHSLRYLQIEFTASSIITGHGLTEMHDISSHLLIIRCSTRPSTAFNFMHTNMSLAASPHSEPNVVTIATWSSDSQIHWLAGNFGGIRAEKGWSNSESDSHRMLSTEILKRSCRSGITDLTHDHTLARPGSKLARGGHEHRYQAITVMPNTAFKLRHNVAS